MTKEIATKKANVKINWFKNSAIIFKNGKTTEVSLRLMELKILYTLLMNLNKPVSITQLENEVLGGSFLSKSVVVHISYLKKKLNGLLKIETIRTNGYIITGES